MRVFASEAERQAVDADLAKAEGLQGLRCLVTAAWYLRQCAVAKSRQYSDEALALWDALPLSRQLEHQALRARLWLVQAEQQLLNAELDAAQDTTELAQRAFEAAADFSGQADAQSLLAMVCHDRGRPQDAEDHWRQAQALAERGNDPERAALAEAALGRSSILRDWNEAQNPRHFPLRDAPEGAHPSLVAAVDDYLGLCAGLVGDSGRAAKCFISAFEAAQACGHRRLQIVATNSIGRAFSHLNDHETGLSWLERGLALARQAAWPSTLGLCLMQTAETLRCLGRLSHAQDTLHESLSVLAPMSASRYHAIALQFLGRVCADRGQHDAALSYFAQLEQRGLHLAHNDFIIQARLGQASALVALDRAEAALSMADGTLALAETHGTRVAQIDLLRVLALIHQKHRLPPPTDLKKVSATLHYLSKAQNLQTLAPHYPGSAELFDELSREYAKLRDFKRAYEFAVMARNTREKVYSEAATSRAIALQIQFQTETARVAGEQQRAQAAAEVQRAKQLEQNSHTLQRLGQVGQEITAHLDAPTVFESLERHVRGLLPAQAFGIYLIDGDTLVLHTRTAAEAPSTAPHLPTHVDLNDPLSHTARCARECLALTLSEPALAAEPLLTPHPMRSRLYAPLQGNERTLGVMTVQAELPDVYGEREQRVLSTLCAYGAIALDNADAYAQLQTARDQLVAQEKMVSLAALVSGVAQELHAPLNHSLQVATTLQRQAAEFAAKVRGQDSAPARDTARGLRQSDVSSFVLQSTEAAEALVRSVRQAAKLVSNFQEVATDRAAERRRVFELRSTVQDIVGTVQARIHQAGHRIEFDLPEGIMLDGYPGALGQVLTQLIGNALRHGLKDRQDGLMQVAARTPLPGRVVLEFRDNGVGLPAADLNRIFEPFFTSTHDQVRSSLGLYICHNIVTTLFGGRITAHSPAGLGLLFVLDLALVAPQ